MNISELIAEITPKLPAIAEKQQAVYDKGLFHGEMHGLDRGIEQGKEEERQKTWGAIQQGGTRTNYEYAFRNWNLEGIRPIYDILPTTCGYMFIGCGGTQTDIAQVFEDCEIVFNTSKSTSLAWMFFNSTVTRVPVIDTTSASMVDSLFYSCIYLETIDEIVLKEDGSQTITTILDYCYALKNLKVSGVIGSNGFNVQWSTELTEESLRSIVNALSTTTTEQIRTVTLSLVAVNKAFETSEGAKDGATSEKWAELTATRSNWTIKYA